MTAHTPLASDLINQLSAGLAGLFAVTDTTTGYVAHRETVRFRGRFLVPAEEAYERIRAHFARLGYTPLFRREAGDEVVIAGAGTVEVRPSRVRVNVILFVLTVLSVLFVGVLNNPAAVDQLAPGSAALEDPVALVLFVLQNLSAGLPYAVPLLTILLFHEFGHYLAARYHGVAVSLPYFIPMPLPPLGTMGAAILQKEPFRNRKVLFDVGVAGPLAGLLAAIPIVIYGLSVSPVNPIRPGGLEGNSLLYLGLKYLVFGRILPGDGLDVFLGPIAFAGWVGLLVTALNLLPAGQFDGGHVAYVLFGERRARLVARVVIVATLVMGLLAVVPMFFGMRPLGWPGWLLWAGLIYRFGQEHPPALDEVTPLDTRRRALAWVMVLVFALTFIPIPFSEV